MNWKYDGTLQEHHLKYKNSILAKIQTRPRKRGGITVITLISGIYFGWRTQKKLEKLNKEWIAYRKKFKTREEAEIYISRKKKEVLKFIESREKEG